MKQKRSSAFTLIELLVVLAIISLLSALLFPALATARMQGRKSVCASNMRQIAMAFMMYTQDYDEKNPRTQETASCFSSTDCIPSYVSWWATSYYQTSLEPYMSDGHGGMSSTSGAENGSQNVWFDPSDPDPQTDPYIWGSFRNNGLVTGVSSGSIPNITQPSNTILMCLRVEDWKDYEVDNGNLIAYDSSGNTINVTMPPANAPPPAGDAFWSSDYFDICLNPWSYASDPTDPNDPYYWARGKAAPPCDSDFPGVPPVNGGDGGCINEYRSIDGNWPAQDRAPRYGAGQLYAFVDGHVKYMPFAQTYQSPSNNMWSTNQS